MKNLLKYLFKKRTHKFKVGDKVIFVNDFGVVWLWEISELTWWDHYKDGTKEPAYHTLNSQTPWFPTRESLLRKATWIDINSTPEKLQERYGFTPTEWFGCR